MSDIHVETAFFERDTRELIAAAVLAETNGIGVGDLEVNASMFDGDAEIMHDPANPLPDDLPSRIARRLRGGDLDPSAPSQWHVRALHPLEGWRNGAHGRIGTVICLGRTFPVPSDYDEERRTWTA